LELAEEFLKRYRKGAQSASAKGACANNLIRFWDMTTFQLVAELDGHAAYVHQIAFSPDGTRLASGSGDFSVRIWDSLTVQERAQRAAVSPP
jgi:WD40 repeat protein